MSSKNKIVDTFGQAYEQLLALQLPDEAQAQVRQLHRAFTDLRYHDSEQARMVEELRATLEARDKKMDGLRREAQDAVQAAKAKDAKIISKDARMAALQNEVRVLAALIQERLLPSANDTEQAKKEKALFNRLEAIITQFREDCNPTPRVLHSFHRCGKTIIDKCGKDIEELTDLLVTHQQLLVAACLQYGSLKLPEKLPDDVLQAVKLTLSKLEDGQWCVEVKTDAKPS